MPTYALGDIQGCYQTLLRLIDRIRFDPATDRLWLVGDLVNRGPRSLEVLRWARSLGESLIVVLGNHDLHLIGRALGARPRKLSDTLEEILDAPDREELLTWLRRQPLLHHERGFVLVHAGLHPHWSVAQSETMARTLEFRLQSHHAVHLLRTLSDRDLPAWRPDLSPRKLLGAALQAFVLLRMCSHDGRRCPGFSGPPEHPHAPRGCSAWFDVPGRSSQEVTVICGHWSALGLRLRDDLVALDTGCVWGGHLSAVRLEDRAVFQEPFADGAPR